MGLGGVFRDRQNGVDSYQFYGIPLSSKADPKVAFSGLSKLTLYHKSLPILGMDFATDGSEWTRNSLSPVVA